MSLFSGQVPSQPRRSGKLRFEKKEAAMFTRISSALAGTLARISHGSVKHHDPDIRLFENDRAAQAYFADEANAKPAVCRFRYRDV